MIRNTCLAAAVVWVCGFSAAASAQTSALAAEPQSPVSPSASSSTSASNDDDTRAQFPAFLRDSYFGFSLGTINYPFTNAQLEPGFQAATVTVPHAAARVILFGHHFNPFLSAQIGYTRPIRWVTYNNLNGSIEGRSVRMAIGDVSLKAQVPITTRTSLYGEGGMAIVSRTGFTVNDTTAMTSTTFVSPMFGGGVEYAVNPRWDLVAGAFYVPENTDHKQPGIVFGSAGFRYNLRALPEEQVTAARESGNIFPANLIQLSFITNGIGYGVNDAVSGKVPIFWGGEVEVAHGGAVRYQRNLWHSESHVSIDVGASATLMKSNLNRENLFALSVYPLLRWTFLRTTQADVSLSYSAAGPTLLSKQFLDGQNLGGRFTFQDLLGVGVFFGKHRDYYLQFDISHYSNGNMAAPNPGVKVPTTITIGRGF